MPQKRKPSEPPSLPRLTYSRDEAHRRIEERISIGRELLAYPIGSEHELNQMRSEKTKWTQYNRDLLLQLFDNASMAEEYDRFFGAVWNMNPSFEEMVRRLHNDIEDRITRLESIAGRLDLIPEPPSQKASRNKIHPDPTDLRTVFVVHGHDEAAKEMITRFLMTLHLQPIILSEQPNAGKTIIEKLESSSQVAFAVVLLTPDDVGAARSDANELELKSRARQNVILELGYFIGKLGRERVCALYRDGVQLPSDYHGVAYVSLDPSGAWKLSLAREMKSIGVDVDLNLAL